MEQQEVKNFSSFSKSLTIMGIFVKQSSNSCLLCLCAFHAIETTTQESGAYLRRAQVTGQILPV